MNFGHQLVGIGGDDRERPNSTAAGWGRFQNKVRDGKYPVHGPAGAAADHALGAGCAWLWSGGGAGRPLVRRYLWCGLRIYNYRSDTTFAVRDGSTRTVRLQSAPCLSFALG